MLRQGAVTAAGIVGAWLLRRGLPWGRRAGAAPAPDVDGGIQIVDAVKDQSDCYQFQGRWYCDGQGGEWMCDSTVCIQ